jgi:protein tyrosine phosphatase (PTP) superfamily phosphohydrolase (DUF442 family)
MRTFRRVCLLSLAMWGLIATGWLEVRAADDPMLEAATLGSTRNVHAHGSTLLCGQPSPEDLATAKQQGVQVVLTLRGENEIDWDEQAEVHKLGMEFKRVDFAGPDTLTDEVFDQTREILREAEKRRQPVMLHCGSANRVGAVWLVYRVLDQGVSWEQAHDEAREVGLRTDGFVDRAKEYVQAQQ